MKYFLIFSIIFSISIKTNFAVQDVASKAELFDETVDVILENQPEKSIEQTNSQNNIYQDMASENLKSVANIELDNDENNGLCSFVNEMEDKGFHYVLEAKLKSQLNPSIQAKRRLMFKLLSDYEKNNPKESSKYVMDKKTWQDLELLCGPKSNPQFYLASILNRTITESGRLSFYEKIVHLKRDISELIDQQDIVRELVNNVTLFDKLDKKLKDLEVPENSLLSFWDEEDIFTLLAIQIKIHLPFENKVGFLKSLSNYLNKSVIAHEAIDKILYISNLAHASLAAYGAINLPYYMFTGSNVLSGFSAEDMNKFSILGFMGLISWITKKLLQSDMPTNILATGNFINSVYQVPRHFLEDKAVRKCFQTKLIYVSTYVNNIKDMVQTAVQNPVLASKMPALKNFEEMLAKFAEKSANFERLLVLLQKNTFLGEASIFSSFGVIFVTYLLMLELKEYFVEAMLVVGELDAQLSIAKLYKEFENKRVRFCFPEYVSVGYSNTPNVKAVDFWNPCVDQKVVVPNSLSLGDMYDEKQNCIITGPNAGGKSTITRAFIISVILGQSIGIVPASTFIFTPFTCITTYLNITEDISQGNSNFVSGVLRAREVLEVTDILNNGEVGLTAVDEVFNGTTFKEGQAAAYSLIDLLGQNKRNMCITNTHFPLIPKLGEQGGNFINYKISVIEKPNDEIEYLYKLDRGISDQVVTLKVLKEKGFNDQFIQNAEKVLGNY